MDESNSGADDIRMDSMDSDQLDFITDQNQDSQSLLRIKPSKQANVPLRPLHANSNPLNWPKEGLPYVTHLTPIENHIVAAFSSPSDSFACLDPTTLACTRGSSLNLDTNSKSKIWGHPGGITKIRKDGQQSTLFWSSGMDGRIGCHDLRQPNPLTGSIAQPRPLLSLDLSLDGNTIAAGTEQNSQDASILYWDKRNTSQPMTVHSSTHSDDINFLAFHPVEPNLLLSGAADGILSISNILELDEDETVVHMANWGCSIARAGWFPSDSPKSTQNDEDGNKRRTTSWQVWSASDMETFAVWNSELDPVYEYGDVRKATSALWQTDYIIAAEWRPSGAVAGTSLGAKGLNIWCGNNQGDVALLKQSQKEQSKWTLIKVFQGGHNEIVRSICWMDQAGALITGGEDGKLTAWCGSRITGENKGGSQEDAEMEMSPGSPSSPGQTRIRKMKRSSDEDLNLLNKTKRQKIVNE